MNGIKYTFGCMNAYIDGIVINDFESDDEAIEYGANYEATVYRIEPDGKRHVIYEPTEEE